MIGERGSAERYLIGGHTTKPVTAFVLRKKFGSHYACFLIGGLAGKGVPGVIVASGRRMKN